MGWLFKWNLVSSTFTWYYLYLSILQNEIWDSSWILILGLLGSGRVNRVAKRVQQVVLNGVEWKCWICLATSFNIVQRSCSQQCWMIISRWGMIVRVSVVLTWTVCDDWRFDSLSENHNQSPLSCRNVRLSKRQPMSSQTNCPSQDYTHLNDHNLPTYNVRYDFWVQTI